MNKMVKFFAVLMSTIMGLSIAASGAVIPNAKAKGTANKTNIYNVSAVKMSSKCTNITLIPVGESVVGVSNPLTSGSYSDGAKNIVPAKVTVASIASTNVESINPTVPEITTPYTPAVEPTVVAPTDPTTTNIAQKNRNDRKQASLDPSANVAEPVTTPVEPVAAPIVTAAAPIVTAAAPIETAAAPIETAAAPVEPVAAPIETVPAPVETVPADNASSPFVVTPVEETVVPPITVAAPEPARDEPDHKDAPGEVVVVPVAAPDDTTVAAPDIAASKPGSKSGKTTLPAGTMVTAPSGKLVTGVVMAPGTTIVTDPSTTAPKASVGKIAELGSAGMKVSPDTKSSGMVVAGKKSTDFTKSKESGTVATKIPSGMINSNINTTTVVKGTAIKIAANHVSLPAANTTGYTVAVLRAPEVNKVSYTKTVSPGHIASSLQNSAGITKPESRVKTPNIESVIATAKIDTTASGGRKDNNRKIDSDTATAAIIDRQNGIRNATSTDNTNGRSGDNRPVAGGGSETGNNQGTNNRQNNRHGDTRGNNANGNSQTIDAGLASKIANSRNHIETTNSNSNVVTVKAPVSGLFKNHENTTLTKVENRIIVREIKDTSNHEMRVAENITTRVTDIKTSVGGSTTSNSKPVIAGKLSGQIGSGDKTSIKPASELKPVKEAKIGELKDKSSLPPKPIPTPSPKPSI